MTMPHKIASAVVFGSLALALPLYCLGQAADAPDADAAPGGSILQPPRWPVMTGTDPGVVRISRHPVPATLETLSRLPRPKELQSRSLMQYRIVRLGPGETTLWGVNAAVVETQHDRDGDYHITLRGASGQRMACELPDPARMSSPSPFARQMTQARAALVAKLHPTDSQQPCDVPAHLTGLGYYGRVKPAGGLKNGLQLHPVVSIVFTK